MRCLIFRAFSISCVFFNCNCYSQSISKKVDIQLGAYYFDGWANDYHLTKSLKTDFISRKPIWGWNTSTATAMKAQVNLAADAGISFLNFCWYYPDNWHTNPSQHPLNHAIGIYLASSNRKRLKFSLLIANHAGFEIGPDDWPFLMRLWLTYFKDSTYLMVDDKPYITFFDISSLVSKFGSVQKVRDAFKQFRNLAIENGFKGVSIAGCVSTDTQTITDAKQCGYDFFTGYNNPSAGFAEGSELYPINKLVEGEKKIWTSLSRIVKPYIPASTLNWDTRPWIGFNQEDKNPKRYLGYSGTSVIESVKALKKWIKDNQTYTSKDKVAVLYAWNEYGEGAWLTPSAAYKNSLLMGVKKALNNK